MESSERYQAIVAALEVFDAGVCITDGYGRLLHQNAALRRQLGEGGLPLERALLDARQAALARAMTCWGDAVSPRRVPHDGRVSVQLRTEMMRYEIEAVVIARQNAVGERFIVVTVRSHRGPRTPGTLRALYDLTDRETRVAALVGGGVRTREIADALGISVHTARRHVEAVLRKLGVHSRGEVRQRLND